MGIVEILAELSKAVCLLSKYIKNFKEEYIIENKEKRIDFTDSQIAFKEQVHRKSKHGQTQIIIKEHFAENGKSLEELLTDVIIQNVKKIAV